MSFKLMVINPPAGANTWDASIGTIMSPRLSVLESWQCASSPGSSKYFHITFYDVNGANLGSHSNIGPVTYSEGVIWTYDYQLNSIVVGSVNPNTTSPAPTATNPTPSLGASQYSNLQLLSISPASVVVGGTLAISAMFAHSGPAESKGLVASIGKNGLDGFTPVKGAMVNFTVQNDGSGQPYSVAVSFQITSDVAPGSYDVELRIISDIFSPPLLVNTFTAVVVVNAPAPSTAPAPTPATNPSGGTGTMAESQIDSIKVISVTPGVANPGSRVNINCALTHIGSGETISVYAAIGNSHAVWIGGFAEYVAGRVTVNIPAHSSKTTLNFSVPVDLDRNSIGAGTWDAYCKIEGTLFPILTSPVLNLCIQVTDPTGVSPIPGSSGPTVPSSPNVPANPGNTGDTPVTNGGTVPAGTGGTTPTSGTAGAPAAGMSSMTWVILAVVAAMALGGGHEKKEERGAVSGQQIRRQS